MRQRPSAGKGRRPLLALVVLVSFAFRLPPLLHAAGTNSDAAIVGLQAMHLLRGEWSPFLFGSAYQTSVDSAWAALFFVFMGPTPLALMLSALVAYVVAIALVFLTLARHVAPRSAALLVLPLVAGGAVLHSYALYPPRQVALTLAILAAHVLDRAGSPRARRPGAGWAFVGGALIPLAVAADPYALVFVPALAGMALLVVWLRGAAAVSLGASLGAIPLLLLARDPRGAHGVTGLSLDVVSRNATLFWETCLPWALGTRVFAPRAMRDWGPWYGGLLASVVQLGGGIAAVIALAIALFWCAARRRRNLALVPVTLFGWALVLTSVVAFLPSLMVMDLFSMRYLAALVYALPFALAPLATSKRAPLLVLPLAGSLALAAWIGYSPFVDGWRVLPPGPTSADDEALIAELRRRGVHEGVADYWTAYRLTFLAREDPAIIPTHLSQDRYTPYVFQLRRADRYAIVVDPLRSDEPLAAVRERLQASKARFEPVAVGRLSALIVEAPLGEDGI